MVGFYEGAVEHFWGEVWEDWKVKEKMVGCRGWYYLIYEVPKVGKI